MASSVTRGLIVAAAALGGLLAGASVDRTLVQLPAWHLVGAAAWAAFSRAADLGHGLIWYPLIGLGAPLVTVLAAVAVRRDRAAPRAAAIPTYAAAALALGHVLATAQAAPIMLSLPGLGDDPAALQAALAGFERWQATRALLQVLTFAANLWSLVAVLRESSGAGDSGRE